MGDLELMWARVEALLDAAPDAAALRAHGLTLLGARRWRAAGRDVPPELANEERYLAMSSLAAVAILTRARAAYGGRMMLVKGPLLAPAYPGGARGFNDIDLLVDDAEAAQAALIAAGFVEVDEPDLFDDLHHLKPLQFPGLPLSVEIHNRPKWPEGFEDPPVDAFFAGATEGYPAVPGLLVPDPAVHALLLAGHGWGHGPLRSLRDLVDVTIASHGVEPARLEALAREWKIGTLWRTTRSAADHLFGDRRRPLSVRIWARHATAGRERTVLETHLEHWLSPFWGLPFGRALRTSLAQLSYELRPVAGESWTDKLRRTAAALIRSLRPRSEHDRKLGELATRGAVHTGPLGGPVVRDVALPRVVVGGDGSHVEARSGSTPGG